MNGPKDLYVVPCARRPHVPSPSRRSSLINQLTGNKYLLCLTNSFSLLPTDLRVYALVQSVDPLRIHLYDEGLARLATLPYAPPTPDNLQQPTMHLTNYAVNKGSAAFVSSDAAPHGGGSKRPLGAVLQAVAEAHPGATKEGLMAAIGAFHVPTLYAFWLLITMIAV